MVHEVLKAISVNSFLETIQSALTDALYFLTRNITAVGFILICAHILHWTLAPKIHYFGGIHGRRFIYGVFVGIWFSRTVMDYGPIYDLGIDLLLLNLYFCWVQFAPILETRFPRYSNLILHSSSKQAFLGFSLPVIFAFISIWSLILALPVNIACTYAVLLYRLERTNKSPKRRQETSQLFQSVPEIEVPFLAMTLYIPVDFVSSWLGIVTATMIWATLLVKCNIIQFTANFRLTFAPDILISIRNFHDRDSVFSPLVNLALAAIVRFVLLPLISYSTSSNLVGITVSVGLYIYNFGSFRENRGEYYSYLNKFEQVFEWSSDWIQYVEQVESLLITAQHLRWSHTIGVSMAVSFFLSVIINRNPLGGLLTVTAIGAIPLVKYLLDTITAGEEERNEYRFSMTQLISFLYQTLSEILDRQSSIRDQLAPVIFGIFVTGILEIVVVGTWFSIPCNIGKILGLMLTLPKLILVLSNVLVLVVALKSLYFQPLETRLRMVMELIERPDRDAENTLYCQCTRHSDLFFIQSMQCLSDVLTMDKCSYISVDFDGEDGVDVGGLRREWMTMISKELVQRGLLKREGTSSLRFSLDHKADGYFCIGVLCGFSLIYRDTPLGLDIAEPILRSLWETRHEKYLVSFSDLKKVEPEVQRNALSLLNYTREELAALYLHFEIHSDDGHTFKECDPNNPDESKQITKENLPDYFRFLARTYLRDKISLHIEQFKLGFSLIVPYDIYKHISSHDLFCILRGSVKIDTESWKKHTKYSFESDLQHELTQKMTIWLWEIINEYPQQDKIRFLRSVTSLETLPANGFKLLQPPFNILFTSQPAHYIPKTHTCFNRLDLPLYRSKEQMKEKLQMLLDHSDSFSIA